MTTPTCCRGTVLRATALLLFVVVTATLSAADPPPPEVAKLITQLKATKAATRLKAVTDLGGLREKASGATDALAKVADGDPDADVRNAARNSLMTIQVATLAAKLKDGDARVRLQAAKELGRLKVWAWVTSDELAKVAENDPEDDVRSAAQKSLGVIKEATKQFSVVSPYSKGLRSKKPAERIEALDQLAQLGEKAQAATSLIVTMMMDNTPAIREASAACLEKVDPKLHKHVVTILYDKSDANVTSAEEALGKLGERAEGAVPALKYRWSREVADAAGTLRSPEYAALTALVSIVPCDTQVAHEVFRLVATPHSGGFDKFVAWDNRMCGFLLIDLLDAPAAKKVAALSVALAADEKSQLIAIEKLVKCGVEAKPALPARTCLAGQLLESTAFSRRHRL